jgi:hypothetical protein
MWQLHGQAFSERIALARARLGVYRKYPEEPSNWEKACAPNVPLFHPFKIQLGNNRPSRSQSRESGAPRCAATRSGSESPSGKWRQSIVIN